MRWMWMDPRDGQRWSVEMRCERVAPRGPSSWEISFSNLAHLEPRSTKLRSEGGRPSDEEMKELLDRARGNMDLAEDGE